LLTYSRLIHQLAAAFDKLFFQEQGGQADFQKRKEVQQKARQNRKKKDSFSRKRAV
jgi:hypothetical protein